MNYTAALVFAFSLLSQFVSCSKGIEVEKLKVVCKTEYSYVLKHFSRVASHLQANIDQVEECFYLNIFDIPDCLRKLVIKPYFFILLDSDNNYHARFTTAMVNNMHQNACKFWNERAEGRAKDIPLREYNVLTEADHIEELLEAIKIGIKVKTNKTKVLKTVSRVNKLMIKHFDTIKACLGEEELVSQHTYIECLKAKISPDDRYLVSNVVDLEGNVRFLGGLSVVDDIALKIELNGNLTYLARNSIYIDDEDYPTDLIYGEYDSNLGDEEIDELKNNQSVKLFWIKFSGGVLAVAVLAGLVGYFIQKKSSVADDKE